MDQPSGGSALSQRASMSLGLYPEHLAGVWSRAPSVESCPVPLCYEPVLYKNLVVKSQNVTCSVFVGNLDVGH
jgi:hypothetical protein